MWNKPEKTLLVYPPCDTEELSQLPLTPRERLVISVAQYRPEKGHALQVDLFAALLKRYPEYQQGDQAVKLVFIGGCRNEGDEKRVQDLRDQIALSGLQVLPFI
jgi:alpha-1,2-mannosyltransferase